MRSNRIPAYGAAFLCLVGLAVSLVATSVRVHAARTSQARALTTFNDPSNFAPLPEDNRVFAYRPGKTAGMPPCLLFYLPDFDPSNYALTIRIRADRRILEAARVKTTSGADGAKGRVSGDVAEFDIDMGRAADFVWGGNCYVGLVFDAVALRPNDLVELVSFEFERVRLWTR